MKPSRFTEEQIIGILREQARDQQHFLQCTVLGVDRTSVRCRRRRANDDAIRVRLRALASIRALVSSLWWTPGATPRRRTGGCC
jgi:hypothetical protein